MEGRFFNIQKFSVNNIKVKFILRGIKMIKIFTDSGADLEPNELEILDIKCVPLSVTFDNITYKENINLTKKG